MQNSDVIGTTILEISVKDIHLLKLILFDFSDRMAEEGMGRRIEIVCSKPSRLEFSNVDFLVNRVVENFEYRKTSVFLSLGAGGSIEINAAKIVVIRMG